MKSAVVFARVPVKKVLILLLSLSVSREVSATTLSFEAKTDLLGCPTL